MLSVSQMLYDFGKVSSSVRLRRSGRSAGQANVLLSIDTVAHDTAALLPDIRFAAAFRPLTAAKDSRVDQYLETIKPDWLRRLVLRDLRP